MSKYKISNTSKLAFATALISASVMGYADTGRVTVSNSDTVRDYNYSEKKVVVADPQRGNNNNASRKPELVKLNVSPSKPSYSVKENMSFYVKGDQDYYLYVFNVNPTTKETTMLIPNSNTKDHHLQAHKNYKIPGTVDFYADRPGTEKLVFIGATRPLPFKKQQFQPMGEFSMASADDIQESVYEFDSKAVLIGQPSNGRTSNDANKIKVIDLQIY